MREWIANKIKLDTPNKDGTANRKHYTSLVNQIEKLNLPQLPQHIMDAEAMLKLDLNYSPPGVLKQAVNTFWALRARTDINNSIQYSELLAYKTLMDIELTPRDIDVVLVLDDTYRTQYYKEKDK